MDIIKETSPNTRIHFFINIHHTNWFVVRKESDTCALAMYLKSRKLSPYEESGYQDLPIEWAFALEFDAAEGNKFLQFIREVKGIRHADENSTITHWLGEIGWYEFADINNATKWLNDFYDFQKQRQQELQKANTNGMQTSMF